MKHRKAGLHHATGAAMTDDTPSLLRTRALERRCRAGDCLHVDVEVLHGCRGCEAHTALPHQRHVTPSVTVRYAAKTKKAKPGNSSAALVPANSHTQGTCLRTHTPLPQREYNAHDQYSYNSTARWRAGSTAAARRHGCVGLAPHKGALHILSWRANNCHNSPSR